MLLPLNLLRVHVQRQWWQQWLHGFLTPPVPSQIHCHPSVCLALSATMETTKLKCISLPTKVSETTRRLGKEAITTCGMSFERRKHWVLQEPTGGTWSPDLKGQRKETSNTLRMEKKIFCSNNLNTAWLICMFYPHLNLSHLFLSIMVSWTSQRAIYSNT